MNSYILSFVMAVVLIIAIALSLNATPTAASDPNDAEIKNLRSQLQNLSARSGQDDEEASARQAEMEKLQEQIDLLSRQQAARDVSGPFIEPVPVNGGDLGIVLGLNDQMSKFRFRLPRGMYTNHVWIEIWKKGEEPRVVHLSTISPKIAWEESELLIKRPSPDFPTEFVKIGEGSPYYPTEVTRIETLENLVPSIERLEDREPLRVGEDVYLMTLKQDASKPLGPGRKDVHGEYDLVLYLKTRFVEGEYVRFTDPTKADTPVPTPEPTPTPEPEPEPTPEPAPTQ